MWPCILSTLLLQLLPNQMLMKLINHIFVHSGITHTVLSLVSSYLRFYLNLIKGPMKPFFKLSNSVKPDKTNCKNHVLLFWPLLFILITLKEFFLRSGTSLPISSSTFRGTHSIPACYLHFAHEKNPEYLYVSYFGK